MDDPAEVMKIISLSEHTGLQALEAYALLGRAVRPVCLATRKGQLEFWGSGVLLRLADEYFLATAAHVLHEVSDEAVPHGVVPGTVVTFGAERHVELHGRVHRTVPPDAAAAEEDRVDAALLELSAVEAAEIDDAHFLTSQEIDVRSHLAPRRRYFLAGFPANWQKRDLPSATLKVNPYQFIGRELPQEGYEELGYPKERNLAVAFDRKKTKVAGKVTASPDPGGTSGGGWWRINELLGPVSADSPPKLVAVMSKHYPGHEKALLAVRISVFVQLLAAARPELVGALPDVSWLPSLERWRTLPGAFYKIDSPPAA